MAVLVEAVQQGLVAAAGTPYDEEEEGRGFDASETCWCCCGCW